MRLFLVLCITACGRVAFEPTAASVDGGHDATGADAALDPTLIAYYAFDDAPDDGLLDSTGQGHTGSCLTDCPTIETTPDGRLAGNFNGTSNAIIVADAPALRPSAITVAVWVNLRTTGRTGLVQKVFGTAKENSWQLYIEGNDSLAACASTCTGPLLLFPTNSWHHLAYVATGTTQDVFFDGVRVSSISATLLYDAGDVMIGADRDNGAVYGFVDGYLDDVRIYSRALSDGEVAALAAE